MQSLSGRQSLPGGQSLPGRRGVLGCAMAAIAAGMLSSCSVSSRKDSPMRFDYGEDPSQFAELFLPEGRRHEELIVIIHGGFWRSGYGASLGVPLAEDLRRLGYVCWNIEYRRVGNGGGWPATFDDVAAAIDELRDVREEHPELGLQLDQVITLGHSAGGQLAVWAAGRGKLAGSATAAAAGSSADDSAALPGGAPRVDVAGAISQAGVLDLARAQRERVGGRAVSDLIGGSPEGRPERYAVADPAAIVPLDVPVYCVHARDDNEVPFDQSAGYVDAAKSAGGRARLVEVTGGHYDVIDPQTEAWQAIVDLLADWG
ncbi:alpha/beta hydrolase [Saxibacter everestensis]|uniref:Alpha/beta hydrolase n=1 Tax=Saxibacter everestensis TaxID=2909229 RepID=A0ABY8QV12_9MICO|nr:alpha/beta hydrolase [Brevibacteriaceae bacterium ZFBP1038]